MLYSPTFRLYEFHRLLQLVQTKEMDVDKFRQKVKGLRRVTSTTDSLNIVNYLKEFPKMSNVLTEMALEASHMSPNEKIDFLKILFYLEVFSKKTLMYIDLLIEQVFAPPPPSQEQQRQPPSQPPSPRPLSLSPHPSQSPSPPIFSSSPLFPSSPLPSLSPPDSPELIMFDF